MTPEETKEYIERRLRESGWGARIGGTSYEKVFRFTDGTEAGAKQICYKLLSLSSLLPDREVTDDLVEMALDGLTGVDDILQRSSRAAAAHRNEPGLDRDSINQLAAVLEKKVATGELPKEAALSQKPSVAKPPSSTARAKVPAARPSPTKPAAPAARGVSPGRSGLGAVPAVQPSVGKNNTVVVSRSDRLMPEARPAVPGTPSVPSFHDSLLERLYRLSSTTTITLSATVLVVVTLTMILYINHSVPETPTVVESKASKADRMPPASAATSAPASQLSSATTGLEPTPIPPIDRRETSIAKKAAPGVNGKSPSAAAVAGSGALRDVTATKAAPTKAAAIMAASKPTPVSAAAPTRASRAPAAGAAGAVISAPTSGTAARIASRTNAATVAVPTQVAAIPAETPPVSKPAPTRISRDELSSLLRRFAYVYEAGDATQFVSLFAENARTNDQTSRNGIRSDYEKFFRSTDLRQISLGQVNWEVNANQAQGWGNFDVTVRRQGEQETQTYAGSLSFQVEKVNGRLRIIRLYHGQRRAGL